MSSAVIKWLTTVGAALALAVGMLLWGVAPASDCSMPHQIHLLAGLPAFGLFVASGGFVTMRGNVVQRMLLFIVSAALIAAYVSILSRSLRMVIRTEISCAVERLR